MGDGLALAVDEDNGNRGTEDDHDDDECAKGPSEVDLSVEKFRNPGTSKHTRDDGSSVDANEQHSVLQCGDIGEDDGDDIDDTDVADPVDGVGSGVHLDVDTRSLHDHTEDDEEKHEQETFDTAPDVDQLGDEQVADTAKDGSHDAGGTQKSMLRKGACNVRDKGALNGLEKTVDEADEIKAGKEGQYR